MKLSSVLTFSAIAVLAVLTINVHAYVYWALMNTSSGFCEWKHFERIPVGSFIYDDEKCEKILCIRIGISGHGCGVAQINVPGYCLVARPGHYPNCCKQYTECDNEDATSYSEENNSV